MNFVYAPDKITLPGESNQVLAEVTFPEIDEHKKAFLTCSYAVRWFSQHPEYRHLVK